MAIAGLNTCFSFAALVDCDLCCLMLLTCFDADALNAVRLAALALEAGVRGVPEDMVVVDASRHWSERSGLQVATHGQQRMRRSNG